jgi:uncharacterized protein YbjT (DUF2867 family)
MMLITGATGTVGREVVRLLSERGEEVRAMARDSSRVEGVAVRGDFDDPGTLAAAAEGADTLFLLSAPGPAVARHDAAMLAAAEKAGVRKVVKVSAIGTGDLPDAGDWHLPGERALRSGGMEWTILRPSSYASNALRWAPMIAAGDPVPNTTGAGVQGVVDPRDVAEVAVRALTSADHAGTVLTPTGPDLLSVPDMAAILARVIGRPLETADIPLDAYRDGMLAAGMDPAFADVAVNGSRLIAEGGNARLTGDVERSLGRPPRTFATWAEDHRTAFTATRSGAA